MHDRLDFEARLCALKQDKSTSESTSNSFHPSIQANDTSSSHKMPLTQEKKASKSLSPKTSNNSNKQKHRLKRKESSGGILFGEKYEKAIEIAQYAIKNERSRHVHTAIDAYIQAGQLLVEVGKQQVAQDLQEIVKKKALALLERAEKLSEWSSAQVENSADTRVDALDAAFKKAQVQDDESFTEKEQIMTKIQAENNAMTQRLQSLAAVAKIQLRLKKIMSEHHLQKQKTSDNLHAKYQENSRPVSSGPIIPTERDVLEHQKHDLINELHQRIGLPEITQFRRFKPLSADELKEKRHAQLEQDLEDARGEATQLREAVERMEQCLHAAVEDSRQKTQQLEQEKAQDISSLQNQLEQLQAELEKQKELANRYDGFLFSDSKSDGDFESYELEDGEETYEDADTIHKLRESLQMYRAITKKQENKLVIIEQDDVENEHRQIARTSFSHDSPCKKKLESKNSGIWL